MGGGVGVHLPICQNAIDYIREENEEEDRKEDKVLMI